MSWVYRNFIRPALFSLDAERIHEFTLNQLSRASRSGFACRALESFFAAPPLSVDLFGLRFPNPVGLAAGMDKNARAVSAWAALGFGFSELGAVTWHAQSGNPAPRIFRAVAEHAIVNRMGFNNDGAEALGATLRDWRAAGHWPRHPVGINLGKSRITPLEKAAQDYANSFRVLRDLADFFVVNVSSPNTPDLRQLQDKTALDEILAALHEVQCERPAVTAPRNAPRAKPILVKVAPDLSFDALDEIVELAERRNLAGIVATNTTLARPETRDVRARTVYLESGGLSGQPLRKRSTEVVRHLFRQTRGRLPIIGVGGIFTAQDAWEKITAGASLIQVYTGLVYEGPGLAKAIVAGLRGMLAERGMKGVLEAVGSGVN